jgi:hypothetical protein
MDFRLWLENSAHIVKELFIKGVNRRDPSILGYHGTSIQTMRVLAERGFLPVAKGLMGVFGNANDKEYGIHIAPNMENKVVKTLEFRNPPEPDAYEDAMGFAKHVSHRHSFFDKYGMDMENASHHKAADEMMMGDILKKNNAHLIAKKMRLNADARSSVEGGVVLAISDKISEKFKLIVGGDGNDINIVTDKLPVAYILGIEPQNDAAYHWLDSL